MQNFFLLFLIALGFSASGAEIKITFSDFPVNQTPTNFSSVIAGSGAPGDWKIIFDDAPAAFSTPLMPQVTPTPPVPVKRAVLAQLSRDQTDERFPVFIYDSAMFKNFKLTTQFKIVSGVTEQMAGMVFRYQNASNFYVIRANALGHNLRFYKVVNGARGNPIGPDVEISTNVWHALAIQCEGDQINFWFDGKPATLPLHDTSFSTGKIGFWTKSDAVSYFGNTTIDYTPVVPAAQTLVRDIMKQYPRILGLRIYTLDDKGHPRIIASKDETEIGQPGTDAEKNTLENGRVFYGHGKGTVAVDMALNDRNGVPVAAVRVQLKSYALAETQDMVLDRVRIIVNEMQKRVLTKEDLMQ